MKKSITASIICVISIYSTPTFSASIELIDGNLITGSTNTAISSGSLGLFASEDFLYADIVIPSTYQTETNSLVAHALTNVEIASTGFDITAISDSVSYLSTSLLFESQILSTQGSLLFNVKEGGLFDYSWNNGIYDTFNDSDETLSLKNAAGYEILNCNAFLNCIDPNHVPLPGEIIQFASGSLLLSQGKYSLSYAATASTSAGIPHNADLNFSLQTAVVPVPAAIWLFGSGLLGLLGAARRKNI